MPIELPEARPKPLGAYRCGGRCNEEGIVGHAYDGMACPKCRVFLVAPGTRYIVTNDDRRYVRARNAMEAVAIYAKLFPVETQFGVHRHNVGRNKKSVSMLFQRAGEGFTRVLSRWTQEQAESHFHARIAAALRIATTNWKIPEGRVAGIVKQRLDAYMKARNLVFPKEPKS